MQRSSPQQGLQEQPGERLDGQFVNVLELFDRVVASAITVSAKSSDPSEHAMARMLDDCLFGVRMWIENIIATVPDVGPSLDGFTFLDMVKGPTRLTLHNALESLRKDLRSLMASTETEMYDPSRFHKSKDSLDINYCATEIWVQRLLQLVRASKPWSTGWTSFKTL